jgi:protein-tyrosine phosphatase
MKLYEQYPGLYTRGKLRDSHLEAVLEGKFAIIALTPQPNSLLSTTLGRDYHHVPIPDGKVSSLLEMKVLKARSIAVQCVADRQPVIIHCNAGRNRACFVAGLTIRKLTGLPGSVIIEKIRAVRPNALANAHFEAYLRDIS